MHPIKKVGPAREKSAIQTSSSSSDDEAPVVTSGIFRSAGAQSFGGAHRGRVCVLVFIGCECACVLWASSLYCVILKKKVPCLSVRLSR